jgi:RNA recognition motif-containing protein
MSQDYTPSRSRGPRRSKGRRPGGSRRDERTQSTTKVSSKPVKKTLWQKITSFFAGAPEVSEKTTSPYGSTPRSASREKEAAPAQKPRPSRKPEPVEVTSPRLYVGNLSFDATESDLMELFSGVGSVANVEVVSNRHTQRSKGFAFVQMQSIDEALRAVQELHDKEYMGRKLLVSGAKAVDERRQDRNSQPEQ